MVISLLWELFTDGFIWSGFRLLSLSSEKRRSRLASFILVKRNTLSILSLLRSVFLLNIKWKCSSISTTVLLYCVAVHLKCECKTDFVLTIFRGADWVLTSPLYVTISQLFEFVVKALSTHSSFILNLLSPSHEVLSCQSVCVIIVLSFESKRMDILFLL